MAANNDQILYEANGVIVTRGRLVLPKSLDEQTGDPETIAVSSLRRVEFTTARSCRWYGCMMLGVAIIVHGGLFFVPAAFAGSGILWSLGFVAIGVALIALGAFLIKLRGQSGWQIRLHYVSDNTSHVCESRDQEKVEAVIEAINMALDAK